MFKLLLLSMNILMAHASQPVGTDFSALADLNNEAGKIWAELNQNGITAKEYLDSKHPFTAEQKEKIRDLKQSLQMFTHSAYFDISSIVEQTNDALLPSEVKLPQLAIHPFLSQLLLENLLLEVSRGWMNDRKFSDYEEAHMILSCIGNSKKYFCPYMRVNKVRETAIKSFANSLILLAIYSRADCPRAGFDSDWSSQAITTALDRHYLISQGNWASKISLHLMARYSGCSGGRSGDLKEFVHNFNALQVKFLR